MHMLQQTDFDYEIIKTKDLVVAELMQTTAFAEGLSCFACSILIMILGRFLPQPTQVV